jgi:Flp pilus assembly protein TadG
MKKHAKGNAKGQALVEFAITLPLFMVFVFVTIELALLFVAYYSETRMARETTRWLAVHSRTTNDDELAAHVQSTMLSGLITGVPTRLVTGDATTQSEYKVGNMTIDFTPCMPYLDVNNAAGTGVCTHTDRVAGATLSVQMSYDARPMLFLPTSFRMGSVTARLPTGLPAYKVSVMTE